MQSLLDRPAALQIGQGARPTDSLGVKKVRGPTRPYVTSTCLSWPSGAAHDQRHVDTPCDAPTRSCECSGWQRR